MLRDTRREVVTGPDDMPEIVDDAPDPEAIVASLSEASRLRGCLEKIEPRRRECMLLAYTYGLTHGEVAGRVGIPLGTAKAWIRRSLFALKECLQ